MISENESHLWRLLEKEAGLINCALDFKYFDMPEIWPRVPLDVSTGCANIYDRLSLGVRIFSDLDAAGVTQCFEDFHFFVLK